jgi:hypothetical protein
MIRSRNQHPTVNKSSWECPANPQHHLNRGGILAGRKRTENSLVQPGRHRTWGIAVGDNRRQIRQQKFATFNYGRWTTAILKNP